MPYGLVNPGFETVAGTYGLGWGLFEAKPSWTSYRDTISGARSGVAELYNTLGASVVLAAGDYNITRITSGDYTVVPGQIVPFGGWTNMQGAGLPGDLQAWARVGIFVYDINNNQIGEYYVERSGYHAYTYQQGATTMPTGADHIKMQCTSYCMSPGGLTTPAGGFSCDIRFDDMYLGVLPVCAVTPDATGYATKNGNTGLSIQLDGGSPFLRQDVLGNNGQVTVQWSCDVARYNYMQAFYATSIDNGTKAFYCNLIIDGAAPEPYICTIEPKSFGLTGQTGQSYILGATLNFTPLPRDLASDLAVIAAYENYGENVLYIFDLLSHLVNVTAKKI